MALNIVVAVTDRDWFDHLQQHPNLDEVNFWSPSPAPFRALQEGELYLFKLHAPDDFIVGGGVFSYAMDSMPLSLAWETFGEANGATTLAEMRQRVVRYRKLPPDSRDPIEIGIRVLTQPFFWPEELWLRPPVSWSRNIVRFKTFPADDAEGLALWEAVQERSAAAFVFTPGLAAKPLPRYGQPTLVRPRLGQRGFRMLVTGIYDRKCAVTRERTLPALDAAHIRPYNEGGERDPAGSDWCVHLRVCAVYERSSSVSRSLQYLGYPLPFSPAHRAASSPLMYLCVAFDHWIGDPRVGRSFC